MIGVVLSGEAQRSQGWYHCMHFGQECLSAIDFLYHEGQAKSEDSSGHKERRDT